MAHFHEYPRERDKCPFTKRFLNIDQFIDKEWFRWWLQETCGLSHGSTMDMAPHVVISSQHSVRDTSFFTTLDIACSQLLKSHTYMKFSVLNVMASRYQSHGIAGIFVKDSIMQSHVPKPNFAIVTFSSSEDASRVQATIAFFNTKTLNL